MSCCGVYYLTVCPRVCFVCFVCLLQRRIALRDVVAGRYGEGSARIVELLRAQMHTEQQHVAEKAIMPAREARVSACALLHLLHRLPAPHHPLTSSSHPHQERLYRLHRDGWIQYLEVARRPDFAPVSTSYFWFVDVPKVSERAPVSWPVRKAPRLTHLLYVCRAPLLSPIAGARGGGTGPPFLGQHTGAAPPLLPIQAGDILYDNAMC